MHGPDAALRTAYRDALAVQAQWETASASQRETAATQAAKLLGDPRVRAAIDRQMGRLLARCEVSQEHVLREAARIAFADPLALFDHNGHESLRALHDIPVATRRAISSIKVRREAPLGQASPPTEIVEIRFYPKAPALELLARHLKVVPVSASAAGGTPDDPIRHEHRHQVLFYMPENGRRDPG